MSECKIEKLNKSLSMASDASLKEKKEENLEVVLCDISLLYRNRLKVLLRLG